MKSVSLRVIRQLIESGANARVFAAAPLDLPGNILRVGHELSMNFLQCPKTVSPDIWKEIIAKTFCEANGFDERRIHNVFASQINLLYQEYGIYEDAERSRSVHALHVYDKFIQRLLNTQYEPSFEECNLITSRLDALKHPTLRSMYCSQNPTDEMLVAESKERVLIWIGQPWSRMLNTWSVLLALNKIFERSKINNMSAKTLIAIDEQLVTQQAISGTLSFVEKTGKSLLLTLFRV